MKKQEHKDNQVEVVIGPGLQLKQARERLNLTVGEVAKKLYLSKDKITALELNAFSKVGPYTFVRGYVRAYARLLHLPVAEVLESFDRLGLSQEKGRLYIASLLHKEVTFSDRRIKWFTYSIIFVFLVLSLAWWYHQVDRTEINNTISSSPISTEQAVSIEEAKEPSQPIERITVPIESTVLSTITIADTDTLEFP